MVKKHVIIVDDDKNLQKYLTSVFAEEGFSVRSLYDGTKVLENIEQERPDAVILDLDLPTVKGGTVCKDIKSYYPEIPVIVLTGADEITAKRELFSSGADDYVTKPFNAEELMLRVKARLKDLKSGTMTVGDLEIDADKATVKRGSKDIYLTPQELKLLTFLASNKDRVLSREVLINRLWDNAYEVNTRIVDVYIGYLKKKVDASHKNQLIHTVRGFGYIMKDPSEE